MEGAGPVVQTISTASRTGETSQRHRDGHRARVTGIHVGDCEGRTDSGLIAITPRSRVGVGMRPR